MKAIHTEFLKKANQLIKDNNSRIQVVLKDKKQLASFKGNRLSATLALSEHTIHEQYDPEGTWALNLLNYYITREKDPSKYVPQPEIPEWYNKAYKEAFDKTIPSGTTVYKLAHIHTGEVFQSSIRQPKEPLNQVIMGMYIRHRKHDTMNCLQWVSEVK